MSLDFIKPLISLQIKPTFPMLSGDVSTEADFLNVVQRLVESVLPENFWLESNGSDLGNEESMWAYRLMKSLPLIEYSFPNKSPGSLPVTFLCPADYTTGVGRYVVDTLSRWLIPGKQLMITGSITLNFHFENCPSQRFFIAQEIVGFDDEDELQIIQSTLPNLVEEMKMNIQAVYHARYIASLRSISLAEKNKLIQENLNSILHLPSSEIDRSLYDHMQGFLLKLSAEEKIGQVKKNIAQLRNARPKAFDRDVFYEMTHFTILFRDQFSSRRDTRHISRVIALHYLFKKVLQDSIQKVPNERHLNIKVFKMSLQDTEPVLGILLGTNLLRDSERVEKKQLMDAIRRFLPETMPIKDSFIVDRRDDKVRFLYIEVQKPQFTPFTNDEIRLLRKELPGEIKKQIESAVHPIFMPRNEEELLRNLITLCSQLKYVRDLPQVSIHYEKQTNSDLSFTILLARLTHDRETSLKDRLLTVDSPLIFTIDEIRIMGMLKNKYLKEGAILRVTLNKSLFFRSDYSVDLLRARQKVVLELARIIGEFRDYNGGMILKQDESLDLLRGTLNSISEEQEFLLENYFYSLRPGIMQTVHDPLILKMHFSLLTELIQDDLSERTYTLKTAQEGKFFLYYIGALAPTFKEYVANAIDRLKIPSYDLTSTFLQVHELSTLGYILRSDTPTLATDFHNAILDALKQWSNHFSCPVPQENLKSEL
ncbi:MAG TPA: hypothetical protein VLE89_00030 [Chlamydiales bacterium]|nr:hypothetical protein [Chlamydiales bacterium]